MLANKRKTEKVTLEASKGNGTCTIQCCDPPLFLGTLGELFGLPSNTTTQVNAETESHGEVEINSAYLNQLQADIK